MVVSTDYEARHRRNDESRNKAENYRLEWTKEEDEFLQEFWPTEPEDEVAESLGRTIEACRQRFYVVKRGEAGAVSVVRTTTTTTTEVRYLGVFDEPEDRWWSPEYYTNGK